MAQKPRVPEKPQEKSTALVVHDARLPWDDRMIEVYKDLNLDASKWRVLCDAIFPAAKSPRSIMLALDYCRSRKLDIMKKPVHIVPMYDSKANGGQGGYVDTVWPSISELRTTAFRTGQYAGCDETTFGPMMESKFTDRAKQDGKWVEMSKAIKHPEWAQITVYRMLNGQRLKFAGPKVYWLESYARIGRSSLPNDMWEKRSMGQLEKCAEAGALRKAFPEELGNEYAAEEMEGRDIIRMDEEPAQIRTKATDIEVAEARAKEVEIIVPEPAALEPPPPPV